MLAGVEILGFLLNGSFVFARGKETVIICAQSVVVNKVVGESQNKYKIPGATIVGLYEWRGAGGRKEKEGEGGRFGAHQPPKSW